MWSVLDQLLAAVQERSVRAGPSDIRQAYERALASYAYTPIDDRRDEELVEAVRDMNRLLLSMAATSGAMEREPLRS